MDTATANYEKSRYLFLSQRVLGVSKEKQDERCQLLPGCSYQRIKKKGAGKNPLLNHIGEFFFYFFV